MNNLTRTNRGRTAAMAAAVLLVACALEPLDAGATQEQEVPPAERSEGVRAGHQALDRGDWGAAREAFARAAEAGGPDADAARYWQAYAESRAGNTAAAARALGTLKVEHPDSQWLDDAEVLRREMRRGSGAEPGLSANEELKLYALQGLMASDPDRALPIAEKFLSGDSPLELKERALFVLSQASDPRARDIIRRTARNGSSPELQITAIQAYVVMGDRAADELSALYAESADQRVKRALLEAAMASDHYGLLERVLADPDAGELRIHAAHLLGAADRTDTLWRAYEGSTDPALRSALVDAMGTAGDVAGIDRVLQATDDPELRSKAIQALGITSEEGSAEVIERVYASASTSTDKRAAINALMIQDNAEALQRLFRAETDAELKRHIVQMLVAMGADSSDLFAEILEEG